MIWAILGGFVLIVLLDLRPLVRGKKWRAVIAFACLFAVALTLGVLTGLRVEIPSAMAALGDFVRWIGLDYPL